jgi:hypothetical protein
MKFALSNRERWSLASLLMNKELKLKGLDEIKTFNRCKLSLGLTGIMELFGSDKTLDMDKIVDTTPQWFDLSESEATFILGIPSRDGVMLDGAQAGNLGNFFDALETWKLTKTVPKLPSECIEGNRNENWLKNLEAKDVD